MTHSDYPVLARFQTMTPVPSFSFSKKAAIPMLPQLIKAETAEREVRSVAYQLKAARLPAYRDLAGFDFASSEINEALVRQLHRCDFIDVAGIIVLVGGPGEGKTRIATALGIQFAYGTILSESTTVLFHNILVGR